MVFIHLLGKLFPNIFNRAADSKGLVRSHWQGELYLKTLRREKSSYNFFQLLRHITLILKIGQPESEILKEIFH